MDYKRRLIENINYVNIQEENFIVSLADKKENFLESYDNWSFKDVVSHMSEWRVLSSKKLESVKNIEYVSFHEDLDILNRQNYKRHKNESIKDVKLLFTESYKALKKQIESFDNSELMGESKIDGFKSSLWQYILIDSFLHPTIHMVFYYIKIQEFEWAFKILENNYILLLQLDNSQETITNYFYLEELLNELDEMINKDILLFNLKEFYKKNMKNEIVSTVVLDHFMAINNI
ncbi:ClbS/DfsB family four-helix bundle protein [Clostridium sp. CF012]|uniref:ClbS/DfsB family four-helix bundle protein n=1 Tax=Clostridium sp. CF012 TaxID=2843319 RepID=UPI001C0BCB8F|nr:ClbS/DfsB family four-helix bundle protein [Clostridium sp. CF012]MBU3144701.1 ClbS/DfsB family four-helix bundle protein [Clostridium sp. CF012]